MIALTTRLVIALVLIAPAAPVAAKPENRLVAIEYSLPDQVKVGDDVTTVLTFRALVDLDRLEVAVAPFKGLDVVSEPKQATFASLKRGDQRQLTVTVHVTQEPFAYLSVTYETTQGKKFDGGGTMIVYGSKRDPQ